jgi:putative ABC transport system substrate-binding protein
LAKAFQAALRDAGYVDGQNIQIDFRWGEGQYARLPALASELVARGAAIILAGGPPAAVAAKAATQTIPIVFTSGDDPVKLGLVASFNRPGGNCTGVSELADEIDEKRLGLLHDVVPNATTIAVLLNPKSASFAAQNKQLQEAARTKGFQLALLDAATEQQIDEAFATLAQSHMTDAKNLPTSHYDDLLARLYRTVTEPMLRSVEAAASRCPLYPRKRTFIGA